MRSTANPEGEAQRRLLWSGVVRLAGPFLEDVATNCHETGSIISQKVIYLSISRCLHRRPCFVFAFLKHEDELNEKIKKKKCTTCPTVNQFTWRLIVALPVCDSCAQVTGMCR